MNRYRIGTENVKRQAICKFGGHFNESGDEQPQSHLDLRKFLHEHVAYYF
jgi:hypothetical protein